MVKKTKKSAKGKTSEKSKKKRRCKKRDMTPEKREQWLSSLLSGRTDARLHPTVLASIRLQSGFLQKDVAKKLGISLPSYCSIERGKRKADFEIISNIATIMDVSIDELFIKCEDERYLAIMPNGEISQNFKERGE